MEILSYSPDSLKDTIDESVLISEAGFSGAVGKIFLRRQSYGFG